MVDNIYLVIYRGKFREMEYIEGALFVEIYGLELA